MATSTPVAPLDGVAVRRQTRRATAARARTTLSERLGEAWGGLVSAGIGVAVAGGSLASLREEVALAGAPVTATTLPASASSAALAVLAGAGAVVVLARLGPVSATPAAAAWWLPLPADRRGLLRGELSRLTTAVVAVAVLVALPLVLGGTATPTVASALGGLGWAVALAVAAVGGTALLQTRGRERGVAPAAGAVAVGAALLAAVVATAGALGARPPDLPGAGAPPGWLLAVAAVVAAALLVRAEHGLGRLDAGRLRAGGATATYAGGSVLALDTRNLGRALAGRDRPPRRSRRFRPARRPWQAVVAGDLAVLTRGWWQLGQLLVAVAVPVVVARTEGLGALPPAVWAGCLAGWGLAATAAGRPAREAQGAPELDRLFALSAAAVVRSRAVLPLCVTAVVCTATGLLLGVGTGAPGTWTLLALAVAPVWAAAALRGAYRPDPDWSGPVVSTPMGALPAGVGATLVQGVDVGVAGSLPLLAALLLGGPTPALVAVQAVWSLLLAAAVLAHLGGRRAG
ncbi:DUF6297 family protein [Geodermatophilus sp. DSM 45219]|uniref:DUF6297 family protein n=1 Tax=Geodermatophilus sp. DSM 45219 TaxID=1881103 RepID=UPI000885DE23|nr:DUF6297 family protein [Geodermatophilus sp. DSM 45219]SDN76622.1 hypothetical protein SAMN05428965_1526 [Geodermatophilus sp. DSM 45219]